MTSIFHGALYTQLGRGVPVPGRTRGSLDCGPATVKNALRAVTRGQLDPSIEEIRRRMGKPGPQTTNTTDAERAVESYDTEMARLDRRRLVYDRLRGAMFEAHIRDAAKAGEPIQLAIHYGTFNRLSRSTGDPSFTGGHSVMIHGFDRRRIRGGRHWRVVWQLFDPLDDGRRTGIPEGPRWVRPAALLEAWKDLGWFAGIVRGGERTL